MSESGKPSCSDLPASSSMWMRVMPTRRVPPLVSNSTRAARGERPVVLGDLIALGEIRVEVVLAREDRHVVDGAAERMRRPHRELHGACVQHRKRAGHAQTHRADVGVRWRPERGAAAAENLAGGQQLTVDFEADDRLKREGHRSADYCQHWRRCQQRTASPLVGRSAGPVAAARGLDPRELTSESGFLGRDRLPSQLSILCRR